MPSISGIPVLDVAIGLSLIYFVFSLLASAINEMILSALNLRADFLERGVRSMLADPADKEGTTLKALAQHRLVNSLVRRPPRDTASSLPRWPSYMPSRTFALVALDTLFPPKTDDEGGTDQTKSKDVIAQVQTMAQQLTSPPEGTVLAAVPADARRAILTLLDEAGGSRDKLREGLERWFDDTMDRVSGWYKRRVQLWLLGISLVVVCVCNVDTLQIANSLLNDKTLRTAVAAQAQKVAQQPANAAPASVGEAKANLEAALKNVADLEALKLPLGWASRPDKVAGQDPAQTMASDPRWPPNTWGGVFAKFFGLLISALALSLGAPFWFDLLNRVARLRNTGLPEGGPRERRPRAVAAAEEKQVVA